MSNLQKKADRILIIGCLLAALLLGVFFAVHRTGGSTVRVLCDGIELKQIALHDADRGSQAIYFLIRYKVTDRRHKEKTSKIYAADAVETEVIYYEKKPELPETGSYNLISVADGRVTMEAADCRDQICVRHRPISSDRENIICLPHKLVVEITGSDRQSGTVWNRKKEGNLPGAEDGQLDGVTR